MSERNNRGESRQDDFPETIKVNREEATGDEIENLSNAEKLFQEIQSLKASVNTLKEMEFSGSEPGMDTPQAAPAGTQTPVSQEVPAGTQTPASQAAPAAPEKPGGDKVVKILKDEEAKAEDRPAEGSPFAEKYRQQMRQQLMQEQPRSQTADARRARKEERAIHREELRKERELQKELRAKKRAEARQQKLKEDEERRKERRARAKELQKRREIRAEVKRQKKLAAKTAKLGGGVVETHGTQISTEIKPVARYSLKDLLGIAPRKKLKEAETEEERLNLQKEYDAKAVEARQAATHLRKVREREFKSSGLGRFIDRVFTFSEKHKKSMLLLSVGAILTVCVGLAGYFNYYTIYEYSYNDQFLGYVKNQDDVLRITEMVQKELSKDKDIQVVIDEDDIDFERVSSVNKDITPDTSDEVLRRLTYMGDLNVKAWGVYVDDRRVGAVAKKETAADVLKNLEKRYSSGKEGAVIEKAEVQEKIEVKKCNTDLRNVLDTEEMTDRLCTDEERESVHVIAEGETLSKIAEFYHTTEEKILKDNNGMDPAQMTAGASIVIKQTTPPVTVRITEKRDYDHVIEYKTEEKRTDEMYEGEEEVQQEGEDGEEEISERYVSINGKINDEDTKILNRKVIKKAVTKVVLIGTAERPPSVGDGVYIWPMESGYTLTSRYGYRWGRLHAGIDLGTRVGNDVVAADGGIVTRAGYFGGYGLCVDIDHQNGQSTRYGHLSQTLVDVGDEVYEGQHIAEAGNTGFSTGPHLHFEIHINGNSTDPLGYLP